MISIANGSHHVPTTNQHFAVSKINGIQKRALVVHEECIACTAVWQKAPLRLK